MSRRERESGRELCRDDPRASAQAELLAERPTATRLAGDGRQAAGSSLRAELTTTLAKPSAGGAAGPLRRAAATGGATAREGRRVDRIRCPRPAPTRSSRSSIRTGIRTTCTASKTRALRPRMLLIPCPWCGEREETEFRCGGEAHIARPGQPAALSDDAVGRLPVHAHATPRACTASAGATSMAAGAGSTSRATRSATRSSRSTGWASRGRRSSARRTRPATAKPALTLVARPGEDEP